MTIVPGIGDCGQPTASTNASGTKNVFSHHHHLSQSIAGLKTLWIADGTFPVQSLKRIEARCSRLWEQKATCICCKRYVYEQGYIRISSLDNTPSAECHEAFEARRDPDQQDPSWRAVVPIVLRVTTWRVTSTFSKV
ncbi:hypothetical protein BDV98DRAFT_177747 [Pterulicium gracile]|uniref:Uncharacterized protein n=1 Tax=Pterulicium gracile TaxID=1884261 RepID=A0A5C3QC69_9AGAR|nr:hypothetical protein BDV98DRAFT_177747 [Pterula gracilis]